MIPRCVQRLGGRKVKSVCLVYDLGYSSFLVFITRLILVVFPRISRVPEKYQSFINGSLIFFGFNCGPIENVYFMRLIKYYMRRIRKALNNNCICRIYLNIFGIDKNLTTRTSYGFKQLTAARLPIFLDD
jgi:hypothetical protein